MHQGFIATAFLFGVIGLPASAETALPAETAAKAQVLINMNPLLGGYAIDVRSSDAGLRLDGAVANEIEAHLAMQLARLIAGDDAEVESALALDAPMPEANSGLISEVQDRTTAARLQQRLRWQISNLPLDVQIEVERGVVRLNGQVGTSATKDRIAAMAESTEGVNEVFNYISVDPSLIAEEREQQGRAEQLERGDGWISSRLRALLQSDTTVSDRAIEIKVRGSVVTLSGSVTSAAERSVAETIASEIPGVREVDSRLIIERLL
ncbi:MAG: BON domain-containing protein [Lamprobacter sp.]|uniref:BON domain-containing protein n=1 Tax=Lamprobacter sp. TaxID=3100796 RepID=UPI002B2605D4|nr:BON domain-containing protein [Lamprobacter sp.]MEA3640755.1 BON domain-containing protein [Lamprobacter sp.]